MTKHKVGPKKTGKEGSFSDQHFIYKIITTVKECARAARENDEQSAKRKRGEVLDMEGRRTYRQKKKTRFEKLHKLMIMFNELSCN